MNKNIIDGIEYKGFECVNNNLDDYECLGVEFFEVLSLLNCNIEKERILACIVEVIDKKISVVEKSENSININKGTKIIFRFIFDIKLKFINDSKQVEIFNNTIEEFNFFTIKQLSYLELIKLNRLKKLLVDIDIVYTEVDKFSNIKISSINKLLCSH